LHLLSVLFFHISPAKLRNNADVAKRFWRINAIRPVNECLQYGFNAELTDKLLHRHAINYRGWLHSNEYRRNALANNVTAQVIRDEKRNLFLYINETPIAQWFMEQFGLEQEQRRGIRR